MEAPVNFWRKSMIWPMLAPIPVLAMLVIAMGAYLPAKMEQQVAREITESSRLLLSQLGVMQSYYSTNILGKAKSTGQLSASTDHKTEESLVPFPATVVQDLSELMETQETK